MNPFKTMKECWEDWSDSIKRFWEVFGLTGIFGIIGILLTYKEWFWFLIFIYYPFVIFFPFVFYSKYYENRIKITEKEPRCRIDNKEIMSFCVYSDKNTDSNFKFRVGEKVSSYYLFFSKVSDIMMDFTLPNKNFKKIERRNKEFYIVKCKKNEKNFFYFPISSFNKAGTSFTISFKIFYSLDKSLEDALKNMKRIHKGIIKCDP